MSSTQLIKDYIINKIESERLKGSHYCQVIAGDIQKEMNFQNRTPTFCHAMYQLQKTYNSEIIYQPPSGYGTRLCIRYYIDKSHSDIISRKEVKIEFEEIQDLLESLDEEVVL